MIGPPLGLVECRVCERAARVRPAAQQEAHIMKRQVSLGWALLLFIPAAFAPELDARADDRSQVAPALTHAVQLEHEGFVL